MAIIVFLFGSLFGITGAVMQLVLGFGFVAALQTYAFFTFAIPLTTLLAYGMRNARDSED